MKIRVAEATGAVGQILRDQPTTEADQIVDLRTEADVWAALRLDELPILVLDWSFPAINGLVICQQVRQRSPTQSYSFIVVLADPAERSAAFAAGADAVLSKPADPGEIVAQVAVARRISSHDQSLHTRWAELEHIRRDLETANAMLSEIASCDALTGLRNRRFFCEALDAQFSLARRKGLPMSLVMIDVDQFKPFNDRYGHLAGDEVLRVVGALLRGCVRDHDVVARYGGEEFAILLPATEEDESLPLVDRLRLTIANHPWALRPVTISLGVATLGETELEPSELLDQADRSLYYSKAMGRNRATHARELPALFAGSVPIRLGHGPVYPKPASTHSFQVADSTSAPTS